MIDKLINCFIVNLLVYCGRQEQKGWVTQVKAKLRGSIHLFLILPPECFS